jgi:hypothetical protein
MRHMSKIKITKNEMERIKEFADARLGSANHYKSRGGFKRGDLICGAMGELAVYKLCKKHGKEVSKPDFEIYDTKSKSFDADLRLDKKKRLHVKSQSLESVKRYGKSWLMQRHDPIFKGTGYNHYMVCCVVDEDNCEVEVLGFFPMRSVISKGLIGECKVPSFRTTKVAIYYDSLDQGVNKQTRWRVLK